MTPTATSAPDQAQKRRYMSKQAVRYGFRTAECAAPSQGCRQVASLDSFTGGLRERGVRWYIRDGRGAILLRPFRQVSDAAVQLSTHSSAPVPTYLLRTVIFSFISKTVVCVSVSSVYPAALVDADTDRCCCTGYSVLTTQDGGWKHPACSHFRD